MPWYAVLGNHDYGDGIAPGDPPPHCRESDPPWRCSAGPLTQVHCRLITREHASWFRKGQTCCTCCSARLLTGVHHFCPRCSCRPSCGSEMNGGAAAGRARCRSRTAPSTSSCACPLPGSRGCSQMPCLPNLTSCCGATAAHGNALVSAGPVLRDESALGCPAGMTPRPLFSTTTRLTGRPTQVRSLHQVCCSDRHCTLLYQ